MCAVWTPVGISVQSRIETSPGVYELSERTLAVLTVCIPEEGPCSTSDYP